jgi:hypothetical protein
VRLVGSNLGTLAMKLRFLTTLAALPLLAACAPQVESTIDVSAIQKAIASGAAVQVPALLRIPQSSEDDCKKGLDALVLKLKALAPVTGNGLCMESDGDQLAEIPTALQVVTPDAPFDAKNLFLIEAATADGKTGLTFRMLKPIEEITKALTADEDGYTTDFDPAKFILKLANDTAGTVAFYPEQLFIDDKPHLPDAANPVVIDAGSTVTLKFSDVAAAFVEAGNSYGFGAFTTPQQAVPEAFSMPRSEPLRPWI